MHVKILISILADAKLWSFFLTTNYFSFFYAFSLFYGVGPATFAPWSA
jgi:hypothetical protein